MYGNLNPLGRRFSGMQQIELAARMWTVVRAARPLRPPGKVRRVVVSPAHREAGYLVEPGRPQGS
jgi:hypothetical protein